MNKIFLTILAVIGFANTGITQLPVPSVYITFTVFFLGMVQVGIAAWLANSTPSTPPAETPVASKA